MGDKSPKQQKIMQFLWIRRDKIARERNSNVGKIYSKEAIKKLCGRLYQEWFVHGNVRYEEWVTYDDFNVYSFFER